MIKKLLAAASTAMLLFGLSACGDSADEGGDGGAENSSPNAAPEPDVADVPDVVAEVNGEEIPKDEFVATYKAQFQQMAMQAQQTGQELDQDQLKQQTAEGMVDNMILVQEADKRGFTASQKQIDQTLEDLVQQNGMGSVDEFFSALEEQGMSKEDVMPQLERQVMLDQLLAEEAGDVKPTEQQLRKMYDQSVAQQKQMGTEESQIPKFEEMKPQLEEQAASQKEAEAAQSLVDTLRKDAEIKINL
ncbi:SurA N-terminal domain-containing protein [Haloactinopolyspora sp.]|uniref:SurA N-terminal domain-containing protein n=1 Tax=Haloactinopolyspora sp. TaxID=1966353 RepID=UPI002633F45D|nr:SurA N-terminal domain-containing protein [Haloactinopolyspora sp.]